MEHLILRCKHCQKEYTYCTYGNGPEYGTEAGCSKEYCAECQKAINAALKVIPVKYKAVLVEINDPEVLETLKKIKEADDKKDYIKMTAVTGGMYDVEDCYTHDWKEYWIKYNTETPEEKHLFVAMQYDILKGETTKKYWKADKGGDSYTHGVSMTKTLMSMKVNPVNMIEPLGKLFFMEM
jgi:hypothetical protein